MSVHPQRMPTTPEGKVWDVIGDLRREISQLRRENSAAVQHAFATGAPVAGVSAATSTPTDLGCSVTVDVPSANSLVLVRWTVTINATNNTSGFNLHITDSVDLPGQGFILASYNSATGSSGEFRSETPNDPVSAPASGFQVKTIAAYVTPFDPTLGTPARPTPGTHTIGLAGSRGFGAGTATFSTLRLWVAVL